MSGFLGNPKLVMMTQDSIPVANFEYPVNPTVSINPVRVPVTWLNTVTGCRFICTDNTPDANVWKLMEGHRGALISLNGAAQNVPTGVGTAIAFDHESYDTDGFHTSGGRFVIPAGVSKVRLAGNVFFSTQASGGLERYFFLIKNNTLTPGSWYEMRIATINEIMGVNGVSTILPVVAGDWFEARVQHDRGVDLQINNNLSTTWFSIEVIE